MPIRILLSKTQQVFGLRQIQLLEKRSLPKTGHLLKPNIGSSIVPVRFWFALLPQQHAPPNIKQRESALNAMALHASLSDT